MRRASSSKRPLSRTSGDMYESYCQCCYGDYVQMEVATVVAKATRIRCEVYTHQFIERSLLRCLFPPKFKSLPKLDSGT
jgi:hypothetical protein